MDDNSFLIFLNRVRAGDEKAAEELVRQYEPEIRREVRLRMRDPRLRRDFDSMDISQSVLASFFVRASLGQFELEKPEQLLKLLVTMTRNKLVSRVRKQRAQFRDSRRVETEGQDKLEFVAGGPSPSEAVAGQELLQEFRSRLTEDERQIAEWRSLGRNWTEIAQLTGGTAEACRKQLARAIDRVAHDLGLEVAGNE